MFKINVDGATTDDGRRSSVEVVIRECRGIMVAARGVLLNASYDVETTEAPAIEAGILLAAELKLLLDQYVYHCCLHRCRTHGLVLFSKAIDS